MRHPSLFWCMTASSYISVHTPPYTKFEAKQDAKYILQVYFKRIKSGIILNPPHQKAFALPQYMFKYLTVILMGLSPRKVTLPEATLRE